MQVTVNEWVFACVVVIAATVAAIFHVLEGSAYAGLIGTAIGYTGKGLLTERNNGGGPAK